MAVFVSLPPALASAHVSVFSGPTFAGVTQKVRFGVGHGCSGADTYSVRIEIPAGVSSVRPESSAFGKARVEKNDADDVVAVMWQKSDADALRRGYGLLRVGDSPKDAEGGLFDPVFPRVPAVSFYEPARAAVLGLVVGRPELGFEHPALVTVGNDASARMLVLRARLSLRFRVSVYPSEPKAGIDGA